MSPSPTSVRMDASRVTVIIPTYNPAPFLDALLPALAAQDIPRDRFLFVDSSSSDGSPERLLAFGGRVVSIPQAEFNHGGTRRMAVNLAPPADIVVMMTQDAIPATGDSLARLISAFIDPDVGMAYGRQLPRLGAGPIEAFARIWNYPATAEIRRLADRSRLGAKTIFCSDSFAAYRLTDLVAVGSFPDAAFAEDQIVAARMICAGRALAYVADAEVRHSHDYPVAQDFARYRQVGRFHGDEAWILDTFGRVEGEGARFALNEAAYLMRRAPLRIPEAMIRTFAKYAGYQAGRSEAHGSAAIR